MRREKTVMVYFGEARVEFAALAPERARKVARVVVEDGQTFAIDNKGKLYASGIRKSGALSGEGRGSVRYLTAAAKLGALPRDQVRKLKLMVERQARAADLAYSARQFVEQAKAAGIALTPAQRRRCSALQKKAEQ